MDRHVNIDDTASGLFHADLTPEQHAFGESVGRLLATASHTGPSQLLSQIAEHGFLGIAVPEEYGGASMDDLRFGLVFATEAMAAGFTGVALRYGLHAWVAAPFLARHAPAAQQARWLPAIASGASMATVVGLREGVGETVHGREYDGAVRLTGTLRGVPGAAGADLLLVVIDSSAPEVVVIDAATADVRPVSDESAAPGLASADVVFDDVTVDPLNRINGAGADGLRADHYLWLAILGVTGARAALDISLQYVQNRTVFGRPVADFENTRKTLAEVAVELASVHALLDECISARTHSAITPAMAASAAVASAAAHARSVDRGLQLHGGYGYMREYPIAQAYADAMRLRLETAGMAASAHVATALGLKTP
jgi:acyl-CoA dehydrogenase